MGQAATLLLTNITEADQTFYVGEFLAHYKEQTVLYEHGQAQDNVEISKNRGTTANWFRYHPLAIVTSATSEGKTTVTANGLKGMNVTAQVEVWHNVVQISELMWKAGRDGDMRGGSQLVGQNAGESVERETVKMLAETGIWPLPRNAYNVTTGSMVASYYQEGITCTRTGSTTVMQSEGYAAFRSGKESIDILRGAWCCVSRGKGYGYGGRITSYNSEWAAGQEPGITVTPAMPEAASSLSGYATQMTVALHHHTDRQLDSGDRLSTGILLKALAVLKKNGAPRFPDGTYHCIIDPECVVQLMATDTTWKNHMTYSRPEKGERGYIGTWAGINFYEGTIMPRYAVATLTNSAFSSTAGVMRVTFVMGRGSFGKVTIGGERDPELIFKDYTSGGVSNPTNSYGTMAWKAIWKPKQLNANFCVGIFSYMV